MVTNGPWNEVLTNMSSDILEETDPERIIIISLNSALDRNYISKREYERANKLLRRMSRYPACDCTVNVLHSKGCTLAVTGG